MTRFSHGGFAAVTQELRSLLLCATGLAMLLLCGGAPAATFALPSPDDDVIGDVRAVDARYEDTLLDIARRYDLGYEEIVLSNPGVDHWLPGEGTIVVLPLRHILPAGSRDGIVLNIPEMRLYYYPRPKPGEQPVVITHPVSVGREYWKTPTGQTQVVAKIKDPAWYPPESIRVEHAAKGDILPEVVKPGPDNPLGQFALRLGISGYLIHGTNNPAGLGMRVTHGCMRLYPEDIAAMFQLVPVGTTVHMTNQPYKVGWHDGTLYLEVHPPLEEDKNYYRDNITPLVKTIVAATRDRSTAVDWEMAKRELQKPLGIPVAIAGAGVQPVASANAAGPPPDVDGNVDPQADPLY